MREYVVQPGDSPASIASRPEMAGCPKCAWALIAANPHKASVTMPNGFVTFREIRVGEKLNLPDSWFDGSLDARPRSYFAALPHPDGVTLPGSGVSGVLGDYASLDAAAAKVGKLAAMGDQPFSAAVDDTAVAIEASVQEVSGTIAPAVYAVPYAEDVRTSTAQARQINADLTAAITAGNASSAFQARDAILHVLSSALASARLALQAFYGDPGSVQVDIGQAKIDFPATVATAAQAAAAAIAADASYCASVAQPHSPVNAAVHAFKTAWNAANPGGQVPINTGTYEQATADALTRVLGAAPTACGTRAVVVPSTSQPLRVAVTPPQQATGLSTGAIVGLGLLGAGAVGGAIYFATRTPLVRRRVRRVSRGFP